jgi:hypothetical protein
VINIKIDFFYKYIFHSCLGESRFKFCPIKNSSNLVVLKKVSAQIHCESNIPKNKVIINNFQFSILPPKSAVPQGFTNYDIIPVNKDN